MSLESTLRCPNNPPRRTPRALYLHQVCLTHVDACSAGRAPRPENSLAALRKGLAAEYVAKCKDRATTLAAQVDGSPESLVGFSAFVAEQQRAVCAFASGQGGRGAKG